MSKLLNLEWRKSYPYRPKENFISHQYIKEERFVPSYEKENKPPTMSSLLHWEYSRIWLEERKIMLASRKKREMSKRVDVDFSWWLAKRAKKVRKGPKLH